MSIKINYSKNSGSNTSSNLVLFSNEKFNLNNIKKHLSESDFLYINDLLKTSDLKKNLLIFEVSSKKRIVLISIKKNLKTSEIESLGAELFRRINNKSSDYFVMSDSIQGKYENLLGHFLHGLKLKSYEFNKYKSKKDSKEISINVVGKKINLQKKFN